MAEITTTQSFADGDTVTAAKLNNITANASVGSEIITNRSELTTIDGAADFVLGYDTSATDLRKIKPDNLIGTGSVTTTKIADSAITTAKIANDALTTGKIAAGAVETSDVADSAITTAKINDSAVTTAKIADGAVTSAKLAAGASATGFRNRIINGDMRIDQRNAGASQSITAASPAYTVDRWMVRPTGGTVTGQRVSGSGSTQYVYQITGGASVTQLQFEQKIEASNSYDLAGSNVTISANISNSLLTTASWVLYYANSTDNFSANTLISSGSWTISSTISRYSATVAVPAAATTGLYLIIYVGAQTSGTFVIGNVQLEAGSTATDFERRPIGAELALCQRYYYKVSTNISFAATSDNTANPTFFFKQTMRSAPTLDSGATFTVASGNSGTPAIYIATGSPSTGDTVYIYNSANNWSTGNAIQLDAGFNAEL